MITEDVFTEVFTRVLKLCVEKDLVSGHIQTIDSTSEKKKASKDSPEIKVPAEELEKHFPKYVCKAAGTERPKRTRPPKNHKQTITARKQESRSSKAETENEAKTRKCDLALKIKAASIPATNPL